MKRYLVIFQGRVQRVGFRAWCQQYATQYGCTGTVRNMSNGMVEMQIQGEPDKIKIALSKIKEGNLFIRIDDMRMKEIPLQTDEKKFVSDYY